MIIQKAMVNKEADYEGPEIVATCKMNQMIPNSSRDLTPQAQSSECNLPGPKRPLKGRF